MMSPTLCCSVEVNIEATEIINDGVQQKSARAREKDLLFAFCGSAAATSTEVCLDVQSEPGVVAL